MSTASGLIGIDEVGRGALAGPVVVAGVLLVEVPDFEGMDDSKKLSVRRREAVSAWVRSSAVDWGIVEIWPEVIDRINILEATRRAMRSLIRTLRGPGDAVVVDAVRLGPGYEDVLAPAKADEHFFCVAAASNVAKVHRDAVMVKLSREFDRWHWEKNKGYGTREHRDGLEVFGRSPLHRKSFGGI